ncbi:MAG TPA: hypothetical protein VL443_08270 [Cyclobacteriaceae bacterium]|jgi:hypothetical protein|nr:hypothetical protein [Cyclobacteriaceae bacterium]
MAQEELSYLGNLPLFLGVETENWSIAQFKQAAINAKNLGVTSLLVKVADGVNIWYSGIGSYSAVISAIKDQGINAVPYMYNYGNKFGSLTSEINILITLMMKYHIVIADLEVEFNGQIAWANQITSSLKPISGLFGVVTWADPDYQNWQKVIPALAPCTNFWLAQTYSDSLYSLYINQFPKYHVVSYPVINLGTDFGANNISNIVTSASSTVLAMWEYQSAISSIYSPLVRQIVTAYEEAQLVIPKGWTYDSVNKKLTAPNNLTVTDGFCQWILNNNWDPNNYPLSSAVGLNPVELGNPSLGSGTVQPFRKTVLGWTPKTNVYEMWIGQEYIALYKERSDLQSQITSLQNQIVTLEKQLAAFSNVSTIVSTIKSAATEADLIANNATTLKTSLDQIASSL